MGTESQIRDALLVLRCQQGDARAFADLVLRWRSRLWAHARRLTGDVHAADDVLQESWAAVAAGLGRLADTDAFPKWVFQIVTNKAHDWIRRQQHHRWLRKQWLQEAARRNETRAMVRPEEEKLDAAIAGLSTDHRAVVSLHYFEGFTVNEISQMLAIPSGTVKSRLSEARQRIRAYMEAQTNGKRV